MRSIVVTAALIASTMLGPAYTKELGIIGKTEENGVPVIYKLVNTVPVQSIRDEFRWMTVISWTYDGSTRNGLPPRSENAKMLALEDAVNSLVKAGLCRHAYSRTGNGLKQLVYYVPDRDRFMSALNQALQDHPRYPIAIKFHEDREWKEFQDVLGLFASQ